jgi:hypothetical protein
MAAPQNPIATEHLPFFITAPGQNDVLLHVAAWFVLLCVIGIGVIFFTIHSLPERMAHRTKKVQLDIVAVLCLLALFTNEHVFWFAALLLAFIDLPDFLTPVQRIARAVENISGQRGAQAPDVASALAPEGKSSSTESGRAPAEAGPRKDELAEVPRPIKKGAAHA